MYVFEIKECLQELEKCKDEFFISEVSESGIENQYFVDFNLPKEEIKNITSLLSIEENKKIQIYGYVDVKDATFKIFESHFKGYDETENEISNDDARQRAGNYCGNQRSGSFDGARFL